MHARSCRSLAALAVLLSPVACSKQDQPTYDWRNRELAWKYGPTTGTATPEHLAGTGTRGPGAMAEGWKCVIQDGNKLTVRPYKLAEDHAMFGRSGLVIGLFDKQSKRMSILRTEAITADNATFSFDLDEATCEQVYDLILWYGEV